jgi:hypothetical protein
MKIDNIRRLKKSGQALRLIRDLRAEFSMGVCNDRSTANPLQVPASSRAP